MTDRPSKTPSSRVLRIGRDGAEYFVPSFDLPTSEINARPKQSEPEKSEPEQPPVPLFDDPFRQEIEIE